MPELLLGTILVTMDDKKVGLQLKKARMESGLSQEEVGTKLGITWEMISRYENGRSSAHKNLERLALIYNKPVPYFVSSDEQVGESLDLKELARTLKEEGIVYQSNVKNVVKVLDRLTGKGLDEDLEDTERYYEISTAYTTKYKSIFALELKNIGRDADVKVSETGIGYFSQSEKPARGDIVLGYDGLEYKLQNHDSKSLFTALAVLVGIEQRFR